MYNRCVKNQLKIFKRLWKNEKTSDNITAGRIFLTHTVYANPTVIATAHNPLAQIVKYDDFC